MSKGFEAIVQLLRESVIVQGLITTMVLATYCYIVVNNGNPPDSLVQIMGLIVGFFFGSKVGRPISEARLSEMLRKEVRDYGSPQQ